MKKILILVLLFIGCDNEDNEIIENNYLFNLNLANSVGEPLYNTEFKVRYVPNSEYFSGGEITMRPSTSISIGIGQESFNSLIIYNLDGLPVDTLIYGMLDAGYYSVSYHCFECDTSYKAGVKLFRYVLETKITENSEVIFRDMKLIPILAKYNRVRNHHWTKLPSGL